MRADDKFMEWARYAFKAEVSNGFERAKGFDGYLSEIVLRALCKLPTEKLNSLACVLPMGVGSTHPAAEARRRELPPADKQAVDDLLKTIQEIREAEWDQFSDRVVRMRKRETRTEAKAIRKVALKVINEVVNEWQYDSANITPAILSVSIPAACGRISVQLDLESTMEMQYGIFIDDHSGAPLRRYDHYLGVLGIGPSSWALETLDCRDKVCSACKFIRWHLREYERLMATP